MQYSQMFNMTKKRVIALFSSAVFEICSRHANKCNCSSRKCSTRRKNAFLQCFHHQFLKFALETQIKAYAAVSNVQHAEKHVFALFSSSIFEICSRNANIGICSSRKCSTCWKNAFLHCFHYQFLKFALETQIKAYAVVASFKHAEKTRFRTVFIINFWKLL